ncbi:hypothetical protein HDV03_001975 [Kappamyces sp. JEL0829]|nr:hypothetical protein HDV03_001975 [Kappamyces sp. JEL0829]
MCNLHKKSWTEFDAERKPIQIRVTNILLLWVKKYPFDFMGTTSGKENRQSLLSIVDEILSIDHPAATKQIRKHLAKIASTQQSLAPLAKSIGVEPSGEQENLVLFQHTAEELAEQLTIIENGLFTSIMPFELLNQAWSKKDSHSKAPNIINLSHRFNAVATWTAKSILDMKTAKQRAERFSKLLEIASHLLALNNYSSLMALIAGLNKACISRLKQTIKEVHPKLLKKKADLETLMSALGSYKNYRASIRSIQPPCVPYIGTYLTDLTYIEDGNRDNIDDVINFSKREMAAKVIRELLDFQACPYVLKSNSTLLGILNNLPQATEVSEKAMWMTSKGCE